MLQTMLQCHNPAIAACPRRDAGHVILYEDAAKRRVRALVGALRDLAAVGKALAAIGKVGAPKRTRAQGRTARSLELARACVWCTLQ